MLLNVSKRKKMQFEFFYKILSVNNNKILGVLFKKYCILMENINKNEMLMYQKHCCGIY